MADLDLLIAILATPGVIAIDTETTIARPHEREVCTVQVLHTDGREAVVHCYDQPAVIAKIMQAITDSPAQLCAHFAIFEAEVFAKYGAAPKDLVCTFIAARVLRGIIPGNDIDPVFSLAGVMMSEFGVHVAKDVRDRDWRLPLDAIAIEYCLDDCRHCLDLWTLFSMEFELSPDEYAGFRVINDAIPAIAECNLNGLVFDAKAHRRLCVSTEEEASRLAFEMDLACDGGITNPNSAKQVSAWCASQISFEPGCSPRRAALLFNKIVGKAWNLTANGQLSLGKNYIGTILPEIETGWPNVGEYLRLRLKYQKHAKLLQAFGPTLAGQVDSDGHLRGSLIPHGARTSRQSCRSPNLQQMPSEEEFRAMFKAAKGRVIVQNDYPQIELVVGCLISNEKTMQQVFIDGIDIHTATACRIHEVPVAEFSLDNVVHVKWRKEGKPVTFACLYGAQASTIALNAGIPFVEAAELLDKWLDVYPGIRKHREEYPEVAKKRGYVELVSGQRIRTTETSRAAQLINAPVQGSAAVVMYRALTRIKRALDASRWDAKLALNVHDEVLLDCAPADAAPVGRMVEHEMCEALFDFYPEARALGVLQRACKSVIIQSWGDKDRGLGCDAYEFELDLAS